MHDNELSRQAAGAGSPAARLRGLAGTKPREFNDGNTVSMSPLSGYTAPLVITPSVPDVNINEWVLNNRAEINRLLHHHGALLFRHFPVHNAEAFESFLQSLSGHVMEYVNRSSPRHAVHNNIYTSTDHPADQVINMHNEHSYSHEWPMKIVFYCLIPPQEGGETPVADSRNMLAALKETTVRKFEEKQILYVRRIGTGLGMPWQDVFQTNDKEQVEAFCHKHNLQFTWLNDNQLKLEFRRPAVRRHPVTGEAVWFNHAFFFNILSLDRSIRDAILRDKSDALLPFQTFYGDGTAIEEEVIDEIREQYERLKIAFPWQQGDILVLDNMLMAHGRNAFRGERKILVGMAEPHAI